MNYFNFHSVYIESICKETSLAANSYANNSFSRSEKLTNFVNKVW